MIKSLIQWLRRVITQPRQELDRWQRAVRFAYDLARVGGRQLSRDRAPQMAAALAFRSLFALVPVLIVGMIVVKGFGGAESFLPSTRDVFDSLGLGDVRVATSASAAAIAADQPENLAEWLEMLVNQAAEVNVSAVGWIGGALIAYAAISLVVTIENSFNIIYRAPQGRSWMRRIPLYWFALTIGPIALAAAWYIDKYVANWIESTATAESLLFAAGIAWNVVAIWAVLVVAYSLMPNTWVDPRAAAAGAVVSAILLVAGKQLLSAYISNAFAVNQLYGSLGLVPLFMFWVYLMWLIVLFGVEVSSTLQSLHGEDLDTVNQRNVSSGLIDPAIVITVMQIVASRFHANLTTSANDIAQQVSLPDDTIANILEQLADNQIVIRVEGKTRSYSLARPADEIAAGDLIKIGFKITNAGTLEKPAAIVHTLRAAQKVAVKDVTLADMAIFTESESRDHSTPT
jgi:membrane protein